MWQSNALEAANQFLRDNLDYAQQIELEAPIRFTQRDEGNVLTAYAFRNGFLEDIHAGVGGFSDEEMKKLMIESSARLAALLALRKEKPRASIARSFAPMRRATAQAGQATRRNTGSRRRHGKNAFSVTRTCEYRGGSVHHAVPNKDMAWSETLSGLQA